MPFISARQKVFIATSLAIFLVLIHIVSGGNSSVQSTPKRKVCIRFDDVQDEWLGDAQTAFLDYFALNRVKLTLAVIPSLIENDQRIISRIQHGVHSGLFEVAVHGWTNEDFSTLNYEQQLELIRKGKGKLESMFSGVEAVTFVPPGNDFNDDTLRACKDSGIRIISAALYTDPPPWEESLEHYPETVISADFSYKFEEGPWRRLPPDAVIAFIEDSVDKYGFAVLSVHPQQFYDYVEGVPGDFNVESFNQFTKVLDWIRDNASPMQMKELSGRLHVQFGTVDWIIYLSLFGMGGLMVYLAAGVIIVAIAVLIVIQARKSGKISGEPDRSLMHQFFNRLRPRDYPGICEKALSLYHSGIQALDSPEEAADLFKEAAELYESAAEYAETDDKQIHATVNSYRCRVHLHSCLADYEYNVKRDYTSAASHYRSLLEYLDKEASITMPASMEPVDVDLPSGVDPLLVRMRLHATSGKASLKAPRRAEPLADMVPVRSMLTSVVAFALFAGVLAWKLLYAVRMHIPVWDGCVYLSHARLFAFGRTSYFEVFRPPFFPFTIACIWAVAGEDLFLASLVQPCFTVATGIVYYAFIRDVKGGEFSLVSTAIFLLGNVAMSVWTNHILVHGEALFFLVVTTYSAYRAARGSPKFWWLAGAAAGFAVLTRYPALFAVLGMVSVVFHPKFKEFAGGRLFTNLVKGLSAFFIVCAPWLVWNQMAYGDFLYSVRVGSDAMVWGSHQPFYFYFAKAPETWGLAALLLLAAMLSKDTWRDDCGFMFALWFLVCLVGFSMIPHKNMRFTSEWTPAIAYLSTLSLEKAWSTIPRLVQRRYAASLSQAFLMAVVAVWLASSFASATELMAEDAESMEEDSGLMQLAAYLKDHMGEGELGATNLAPYLAYFTGSRFENVWVPEERFREQLTRMKATWVVMMLYEESDYPYWTAKYLDRQTYLVKVGVWESSILGSIAVYRVVGA